jgi:hypothetical protein
MLLAELITLLSDPKQSLGEALYKTKVLFHQLGCKDLVPSFRVENCCALRYRSN